MADEQIRVDYQIDADDVKAAAAATKGLKQASEDAADSIEKVEGATKKAGKGTADLGQSALQTGRAVQDFAQGGIGGVLNNIEQLVVALGGGPGLAGALTLAGVGFLLLKDPVSDFVKSMTDGGREIPRTRDAVARLAEALKETGEKLEALKAGWDGSAASLAEYNRLTAESERLEKQANAAREAAAAIEAQRRKERQGDAESMKAVSDATEKAGGVDKVIEDLAVARPGASAAAKAQLDQLRRERDEALAATTSTKQQLEINTQFNPQIRAAEATLEEAAQEAKDAARELWSRANQGDQAAITQVERAIPGRGFGDATTAALAVRKEAEKAIGETVKGAIEGAVGWAKDRRAEAEDDKIQASAEKFREGQDRERQNREEQLRIDIAENDRRNAEQAPARERQAVQERARNVAQVQDGRQRAELQQFAASQGVDIPSEHLGSVLNSMKGFMRAGADANMAALAAMQEFIQASQGAMANTAAMAAQFRAMQQRAWQMQQMNGSLLNRGGG